MKCSCINNCPFVQERFPLGLWGDPLSVALGTNAFMCFGVYTLGCVFGEYPS